MKRFWLNRLEDPTGCSGTGIVVEGIQFTNGRCRYWWFPGTLGVATEGGADTIEEVIKTHGHNGKTVLVWADHFPAVPPPELFVDLLPALKPEDQTPLVYK